MVISLVLTDKYVVGVSNTGKVKLDSHTVDVKNIPFVRYRFQHYGESEIEFIKSNMERFKGPIHLAEVQLSDDCDAQIKAIKALGNVAVFLYVPVEGSDTEFEKFLVSKSEVFDRLADLKIDRVMLKDKSSKLFPFVADMLKRYTSTALGHSVKAEDIGVCGSPLSFKNSEVESQACLTALWARRIMAEYSESDDIVVPSASQECMTCCGCLQYFVVDKDIPCPTSNKEAKKVVVASEKSEKAPKAPKKARGMLMWNDDI